MWQRGLHVRSVATLRGRALCWPLQFAHRAHTLCPHAAMHTARVRTAKLSRRWARLCRAWSSRAKCSLRLYLTDLCVSRLLARPSTSVSRPTVRNRAIPPMCQHQQVLLAFTSFTLAAASAGTALLSVPSYLYQWVLVPWRRFDALRLPFRSYPCMPLLNQQVLGAMQGGVLVPNVVRTRRRLSRRTVCVLRCACLRG